MEGRRGAHRYKLPLSVVVRLMPASSGPELLHARTRDVSTRGVEVTQGSPVVVAAQARVVRQEERPDNLARRVGIAAQFEQYNLIR